MAFWDGKSVATLRLAGIRGVENTEENFYRGSITVRLTSSLTGFETCLTSLEMYFALMLSIGFSSFDYIAKSVIQQVSHTVTLPPQSEQARFLSA